MAIELVQIPEELMYQPLQTLALDIIDICARIGAVLVTG